MRTLNEMKMLFYFCICWYKIHFRVHGHARYPHRNNPAYILCTQLINCVCVYFKFVMFIQKKKNVSISVFKWRRHQCNAGTDFINVSMQKNFSWKNKNFNHSKLKMFLVFFQILSVLKRENVLMSSIKNQNISNNFCVFCENHFVVTSQK